MNQAFETIMIIIAITGIGVGIGQLYRLFNRQADRALETLTGLLSSIDWQGTEWRL